MQTSDASALRAAAFACCAATWVTLAACSSSDSGSTTNTSASAGGAASVGGNSASASDATGSGGTEAGGAGGSSAGDSGAAASGGLAGAAGADERCSVVVESHTLDAGIHVTECSHIDYSTNPPSSGMHYPVWAAYQAYDFPVPRGYWVHGLEHGAIVITYNCPDGCPDEVAEVEAFIQTLPIDPRCIRDGLDRQVILTPDPLLDTRWAMSSWGYTLRAACVDEAAFGEFYEAHVAQGPEDICGGGLALSEATLAPNCGE